MPKVRKTQSPSLSTDTTVSKRAIGLLDHEDAAHDDVQVRKDHQILLHLYDRLGECSRPYLARAIQKEPEFITADAWTRAALDLYKYLPSLAPKTEFEPVDPIELENKLTAVIDEDKDELAERELRLLIANTSRSVINAWITDLNRHYIPGMSLNRFMLRQHVGQEVLQRALAPFHIDNLQDVIIYAMRDLAVGFFEGDSSIVELPATLKLVPAKQYIDGLGEYDVLTVYRDKDLSEDVQSMLASQTADGVGEKFAASTSPTAMDAQSFYLRQSNLWWNELQSSVDSSEPTKLGDYALPDSIANDAFFDKIQVLAQRELGDHIIKGDNLAGFMQAFNKELNKNIGSDGITLINGIRVSSNDDGNLHAIRGEKSNSFLAEAKAMVFQAFRQAGRQELTGVSI